MGEVGWTRGAGFPEFDVAVQAETMTGTIHRTTTARKI
jgi:hypothetical protein